MAFAAATAMAEAGLLALTMPGALPLAPQVSALPPLAIFHDLRWLYSSSRPWPVFAVLLAALVVARAAVTALMARLAWPRDPPRPAAGAAFRSALALTVFLSVILSPVVSLSFGVAILPFSWPYLASLLVMLAIAATAAHGGLTGDWWRSLPPPAAVGWLLADFLALSAAAAAIIRLPVAGAIPAAGLAGLVNARAWYGVTAAVARAQWGSSASGARPPRRIPLALIATAAVIAVTIAATRVVFVATSPAHHVGSARPTAIPAAAGIGQLGEIRQVGRQARHGVGATGAAPGRAHRHAVLVVPGFGSYCCGGTLSLARVMPDAIVRQFSYLGLDSAGRPLPYGADASNLPLPVLGNRIAEQVRRLHAATGLPVDVVAESEGTLGVDAMLAQDPDVPIGVVVLLSPIVAPGQDGYWNEGGRGLVPRAELNAVIWFVGGLSRYGTAGAQTLVESAARHGARFAAEAVQRRPSRLLEVVPLADAVTLPACRLPHSVRVLPAFHGILLGDPAALRMVRDFVDGRPAPGGSRWRGAAELMAAAAAAWRMPETGSPPPLCAP